MRKEGGGGETTDLVVSQVSDCKWVQTEGGGGEGGERRGGNFGDDNNKMLVLSVCRSGLSVVMEGSPGRSVGRALVYPQYG